MFKLLLAFNWVVTMLAFSGKNRLSLRSLVIRPLTAAKSGLKSMDHLKVGGSVQLKDGRQAVIVEKKGSGWWRLKYSETNEIFSLRTKDFSAVNAGKPNFCPQPDVNTNLPAETQIWDISLPTIQPVEGHLGVKDWVIFSDLHVKGSSIECCEEALQKVHEAAAARKAGIIFLGDFWHVRGAISVELLNRVLVSLSKWTEPVIMIPGNHDQVTLGGAVHALEPLTYAFKPGQLLMISEPCVYLGALWIPYRRDKRVMKAVLDAGAKRCDVNMIFCHADIRGAFMNDGMRCKEGLEMSDLPPHIPIYSGHFHKPHTIKLADASIRYVGSPYQTALSEASQQKYLYRLNSGVAASAGIQSNIPYRWKEAERWSFDIGKKFYKVSSVKEAMNHAEFKKGDRVVIPVLVGEESEAERIAGSFRDRGVEVELRKEQIARFGSNEDGSAARFRLPTQLNNDGDAARKATESTVNVSDPVALFTYYMESTTAESLIQQNETENVSEDANSSIQEPERVKLLREEVKREGVATLTRLVDTVNVTEVVGSAVGGSGFHDLVLDKITLQNFGPYGNSPVTYPIAKRGLVLVTGRSTDGTGADSNGSGKSTLAMSALWALTGNMDSRLVADGKALDVAHDGGDSGSKKTAIVTVQGYINQQAFSLTRKRGPRKTDLKFELDGKDLTNQAVKDTQEVVDEILGIKDGLLQRCCFFGQHSHTLQSLLGLTDIRLKNELGVLVDTRLWTAALQDVRLRERTAKSRFSDIAVEQRMRQEELDRNQRRFENQEGEKSSIAGNLKKEREKVLEELGVSRMKVSEEFGHSSVEQVAAELQECKITFAEVDRKLKAAREGSAMLMQRKFDSSTDLNQQISVAKQAQAAHRSTANATSLQLNALLSKKKQVDQQISSLEQKLNRVMQSFSSLRVIPDQGSVENEADPNNWDVLAVNMRQKQESLLSANATIDVRIASLVKSISKLTEIQGSNISKELRLQPCHDEKSENCPTCGQLMPTELRDSRLREMTAELASLKNDREASIKACTVIRQKLDHLRELQDSRLQNERLLESKRELESQISAVDRLSSTHNSSAENVSMRLQDLQSQLVSMNNTFKTEEERFNREITSLSQESNKLRLMEISLSSKLEKMRLTVQESTTREHAFNATIALLEEKLRACDEALLRQTESIDAIKNQIAAGSREQADLVHLSAVLEKLGNILGPRGIQHYLFSEIIYQIQDIANSFLSILADSGIQISLQGEGDSEKIIKTVHIRGADGEYHERALSQLSGGQWRRVSLALDLAFVEVVRRKGLLRSNFIVMDEVLTHLDATGREAVGSVFRAMVQGAAGKKDQNKEFDALQVEDNIQTAEKSERRVEDIGKQLVGAGAYETVLVILQDLAAMEMEEAFDHVDVVVKTEDSASVEIDGATHKY